MWSKFTNPVIFTVELPAIEFCGKEFIYFDFVVR